MSLGVYSNNFIQPEKYAIKDNSSLANKEKDPNGHNSFLDEFEKEETDEKRIKAQLDKEDEKDKEKTYTSEPDFYSTHSRSTINDYLDNFLLINAEQVACSNMTQQLIRSDELKKTLGFLNTKASEQAFAGKKRPKFESAKQIPQFKATQTATLPTQSSPTNFFSTGIDASTNNFFMGK